MRIVDHRGRYRRRHERAARGTSALDIEPKLFKGSSWSHWAKRWSNKAKRRLAKFDIDTECIKLDEETQVDVRCADCCHPPEAHHGGNGQCYSCPAEARCPRWEPRSQEARAVNERR